MTLTRREHSVSMKIKRGVEGNNYKFHVTGFRCLLSSQQALAGWNFALGLRMALSTQAADQDGVIPLRRPRRRNFPTLLLPPQDSEGGTRSHGVISKAFWCPSLGSEICCSDRQSFCSMKSLWAPCSSSSMFFSIPTMESFFHSFLIFLWSSMRK